MFPICKRMHHSCRRRCAIIAAVLGRQHSKRQAGGVWAYIETEEMVLQAGAAHLEGLDEDVFGDEGGAREEAGHVGGGCGAGDGRHVGAGQLPQQQLHQAYAAVLGILHSHTLSHANTFHELFHTHSLCIWPD